MILDTGPLVTFLAAGDEHHEWDVERPERANFLYRRVPCSNGRPAPGRTRVHPRQGLPRLSEKRAGNDSHDYSALE